VQAHPASRPLRSPTWWHVPALVAVAVAYQSLFIHHGIAWLFDEGWPLYAAMRIHEGGVLYADTLFPFPPGHMFVAWIAYGLDPPGIVLARVLYAGFDVALCVSLYFLGRRLTTPSFAFLGALLVAVAAPRSHLAHLLFGYRYLVFSVLVLLLYSRRLELPAGQRRSADRLLFAAGVFAGIALAFRLTPAFAVSCGLAVAILVANSEWRTRWRDAIAYALGLSLIAAPLLAWFAWTVGLDVLWREVVTRIVALQSAQSLPSPAFGLLPDSADRSAVYRWWVALQYRLYIVLYAGYGVGLLWLWLRGLRARRRYSHALLLAVVVWGGLYLLRALGRSDDHHLMSALPPACLLIAHGLGVVSRRGFDTLSLRGLGRAAATALLGALMMAAWVYLQRVDVYLLPRARGVIPLASTGGEIRVARPAVARRVDAVVATIRRLTRPEDVILDMSGAPLFHPLTGRLGPGSIDVISPGIFLSADEERAFVALLAASPPAAIIWPEVDFDRRKDRGIARTAPALSAWIRSAYREEAVIDRYRILVPR
jgi:hypothetical protein